MKAILTTAFRSLHSVLVDLYDYGYEILSAHYTPESIGMECALRFIPKDVAEYLDRYALDKTAEMQKTAGGDFINLPAIGGKRILENKLMSDLFFMHIDTYSIFARQELLKYYEKEFDIVGSLVHMESGKSCGVIADYAHEKKIPHFCAHNGITGRGSMIFSSLPFFGNKIHTHHYIPGKWTEDFINSRYRGVDYTITGHTHFDQYYKKRRKRLSNTFLYQPSLVFSRKPLEHHKKDILVNDSMYSWSRKVVPLQNDINFFKAFAKYQREVDQKAEVLIPFRQFVSTWEGNIQGLTTIGEIFGVENIIPVTFGEIPLWKLLFDCTALITPYSTLTLDGVICRTPTLMLLGDRYMFDAYGGNGCYLECVNDPEEIFKQLIVLTDEKSRKKMIEKCDEMAAYYNYDDDGKATERVVEDIIRRTK